MTNLLDNPERKYMVLGLLFSKDRKYVALVRKQRPKVFEGALNGVGGKIEQNETSLQAIIRECLEEMGIHVPGWNLFSTLSVTAVFGGGLTVVYCYRSFLTIDDLPKLEKLTDEEPGWFYVDGLDEEKLCGGIQWLIPLALDPTMQFCDVKMT